MFAGLALAVLLLAACGGTASPALSAPPVSGAASGKPVVSAGAAPAGQLKTLKIATPVVGSAFAYLYAARDLGYFKNHGIDAQIIALAPAASVAALQAGDLAFSAAVGSVARSALKGINVRVVLLAANKPNFIVLGAKGVTSIDQVKGKVVAVDAPGSTSFVMLTEVLKRKGLQPGQYQTVAANSDQARSLLVSNGQASACILDVSNAVKLEEEGYPVLAGIADLPEAPFSGLGTSPAAIQKNPDLLKAGLQATLEGIDAMRTKKAEVLPIMAKTLSITPAQAGAVFDAMQPSWTTDGRSSQAATDFELTNDQQALKLKQKPTPDQIYDFSLLDSLAKK